jgi:hypothetical protein
MTEINTQPCAQTTKERLTTSTFYIYLSSYFIIISYIIHNASLYRVLRPLPPTSIYLVVCTISTDEKNRLIAVYLSFQDSSELSYYQKKSNRSDAHLYFLCCCSKKKRTTVHEAVILPSLTLNEKIILLYKMYIVQPIFLPLLRPDSVTIT